MPQKFNSLARILKPLYASFFLRKIPECGPRVSIRYHGFLPFLCFPAGPPDALSPRACWSYGSPAPSASSQDAVLCNTVFNLWHGFPFLIVNRPLTLLLESIQYVPRHYFHTFIGIVLHAYSSLFEN